MSTMSPPNGGMNHIALVNSNAKRALVDPKVWTLETAEQAVSSLVRNPHQQRLLSQLQEESPRLRIQTQRLVWKGECPEWDLYRACMVSLVTRCMSEFGDSFLHDTFVPCIQECCAVETSHVLMQQLVLNSPQEVLSEDTYDMCSQIMNLVQSLQESLVASRNRPRKRCVQRYTVEWKVPLVYLMLHVVCHSGKDARQSLQWNDAIIRLADLFAKAFPNLLLPADIQAGLALYALDLMEASHDEVIRTFQNGHAVVLEGLTPMVVVDLLLEPEVLFSLQSLVQVSRYSWVAKCADILLQFSHGCSDETVRREAAFKARDLLRKGGLQQSAYSHLDSLESKVPNTPSMTSTSRKRKSQELTVLSRVRRQVLHPGFPLLVEIEINLCVGAEKQAVGIASRMEDCSALPEQDQTRAWNRVLDYLQQTNQIFLDGNQSTSAAYQEKRNMFLSIVSSMGNLGRQVLLEFFVKMVQVVEESPRASPPEIAYVKIAAQQTVLRLCMAKYGVERGIEFFKETFPSASLWVGDLKQWATRFLLKPPTIPPSILVDGHADICELVGRVTTEEATPEEAVPSPAAVSPPVAATAAAITVERQTPLQLQESLEPVPDAIIEGRESPASAAVATVKPPPPPPPQEPSEQEVVILDDSSDEEEEVVEGTASEDQDSDIQGDHDKVEAAKSDDDTAEPEQVRALFDSDEERPQRDALETVHEEQDEDQVVHSDEATEEEDIIQSDEMEKEEEEEAAEEVEEEEVVEIVHDDQSEVVAVAEESRTEGETDRIDKGYEPDTGAYGYTEEEVSEAVEEEEEEDEYGEESDYPEPPLRYRSQHATPYSENDMDEADERTASEVEVHDEESALGESAASASEKASALLALANATAMLPPPAIEQSVSEHTEETPKQEPLPTILKKVPEEEPHKLDHAIGSAAAASTLEEEKEEESQKKQQESPNVEPSQQIVNHVPDEQTQNQKYGDFGTDAATAPSDVYLSEYTEEVSWKSVSAAGMPVAEEKQAAVDEMTEELVLTSMQRRSSMLVCGAESPKGEISSDNSEASKEKVLVEFEAGRVEHEREEASAVEAEAAQEQKLTPAQPTVELPGTEMDDTWVLPQNETDEARHEILDNKRRGEDKDASSSPKQEGTEVALQDQEADDNEEKKEELKEGEDSLREHVCDAPGQGSDDDENETMEAEQVVVHSKVAVEGHDETVVEEANDGNETMFPPSEEGAAAKVDNKERVSKKQEEARVEMKEEEIEDRAIQSSTRDDQQMPVAVYMEEEGEKETTLSEKPTTAVDESEQKAGGEVEVSHDDEVAGGGASEAETDVTHNHAKDQSPPSERSQVENEHEASLNEIAEEDAGVQKGVDIAEEDGSESSPLASAANPEEVSRLSVTSVRRSGAKSTPAEEDVSVATSLRRSGRRRTTRKDTNFVSIPLVRPYRRSVGKTDSKQEEGSMRAGDTDESEEENVAQGALSSSQRTPPASPLREAISTPPRPAVDSPALHTRSHDIQSVRPDDYQDVPSRHTRSHDIAHSGRDSRAGDTDESEEEHVDEKALSSPLRTPPASSLREAISTPPRPTVDSPALHTRSRESVSVGSKRVPDSPALHTRSHDRQSARPDGYQDVPSRHTRSHMAHSGRVSHQDSPALRTRSHDRDAVQDSARSSPEGRSIEFAPEGADSPAVSSIVSSMASSVVSRRRIRAPEQPMDEELLPPVKEESSRQSSTDEAMEPDASGREVDERKAAVARTRRTRLSRAAAIQGDSNVVNEGKKRRGRTPETDKAKDEASDSAGEETKASVRRSTKRQQATEADTPQEEEEAPKAGMSKRRGRSSKARMAKKEVSDSDGSVPVRKSPRRQRAAPDEEPRQETPMASVRRSPRRRRATESEAPQEEEETLKSGVGKQRGRSSKAHMNKDEVSDSDASIPVRKSSRRRRAAADEEEAPKAAASRKRSGLPPKMPEGGEAADSGEEQPKISVRKASRRRRSSATEQPQVGEEEPRAAASKKRRGNTRRLSMADVESSDSEEDEESKTLARRSTRSRRRTKASSAEATVRENDSEDDKSTTSTRRSNRRRTNASSEEPNRGKPRAAAVKMRRGRPPKVPKPEEEDTDVADEEKDATHKSSSRNRKRRISSDGDDFSTTTRRTTRSRAAKSEDLSVATRRSTRSSAKAGN